MTQGFPSGDDALSLALADALEALARGVADERSPLRWPSLATNGQDGEPSLRVVVLRAFDPNGPSLCFYTDRRSRKFGELLRDDRCSLLAYDPETRVQLRVDGRATLHVGDAIAGDVWARCTHSNRVGYGTDPAPGRSIEEGGAYALPEGEVAVQAGRSNFCAVNVSVRRLERLHLAREGHRRAEFEFASDGTVDQSTWLVP